MKKLSETGGTPSNVKSQEPQGTESFKQEGFIHGNRVIM